MIRRDIAEVTWIENECFEYPWCEEDFFNCLRARSVIGRIVEQDEQVVGYMVYKLFRNKVQLWNFAVHPEFQRMRVGTQMMNQLRRVLDKRRSIMLLEVRESNLDAQLFFKECGFRAMSILKRSYADTDEDAYVMRFMESTT